MSPIDISFLNPTSKAFLAQYPEAINFDVFTASDARSRPDGSIIEDIKAPVVDIEQIEIPDQNDGHLINCTVYKPIDTPADAKLPVFVYIPGGGFCCIHEPNYVYFLSTVGFYFVVELNCIALFVNYSLSPEVKFPVALYECHSVIDHVTKTNTAAKLQIDATRVVVGGDSAGGNLSTAVALLAKQRKLQHPIKHQILYYPFIDNDSTTESYTKFGEGFYFTKKMADYFLEWYAPDKELKEDILLFPNKASVEDLVGLPPAFLVTCEADIVRDEGESYGRRLRAANVPVSSVRVNGVLHGFVSSPPLFSDESYHIIDMTKTVLRKAFNADT
ncbi:hypothetical protein [Parasitella parasitica]|uniref:Alpha/beta hydrolase fold-3 domain-containing protein n=1 Tax=Parasitella parasitica TaxID=35722 RepID=A0A0B7MRS2_9FUNG|nr:hypothetical protein [Parasitella parasitica]